MASVFAIRDAVETKVQLLLDNLVYRGIFNGFQGLFQVLFSCVDLVSNVEKLLRTQERAKLLSPEGRSLGKGCGHGDDGG
jgi:hypothetical protein